MMIILNCLSLFICFVVARQADHRSKFLYRDQQLLEQTVVLEYEPHMHIAPHYVEENPDLQNFVEEEHDHLDENANSTATLDDVSPHYRRPFFLRRAYPIPRVVQFYSPWCGVCQSLVPQYLTVAKYFLDRLPPYALEFYAVSCSEHRLLCHEDDEFDTIRHFPTIRMYLPQATTKEDEFIELSNISIATITEALPFSLPNITKKGTTEAEDEKEFVQESKGKTVDILGATQDGYRHTRTDVYRDAALSLTYALEHHIYSSDANDDDPLSPEQASALLEWLDLLHWTLPPTWMVHTLLNDLRQNRTALITSKDVLLTKVRTHNPVIHNNQMEWSEGCGSGDSSNNILSSFSCGLWCLFHIIGCGVYERHSAVLGHKDRVSTHHAAETLIGYMTHFFGWCTQCRDQALELYHNCAFSSCTRFLHRSTTTEHLNLGSSSNNDNNIITKRQERRRKKPPPDEHWKEFPLWLYELHNEINERLLTKEARKLYGRLPTIAEYHYAQWPPVDACPLCFKDDDLKRRRRKPNRRFLYDYIREEYWPTGIQNFRYVVLDARATEQDSYSKNHYSKEKNVSYLIRHQIWQPVWEEVQYIWYYYTIAWRKHPWFRQIFQFQMLIIMTILIVTCYQLYQTTRRRLSAQRLRQTGKHKKHDYLLQDDDDDNVVKKF